MKRQTIYFVALSIVASAINYIAYPLLSRILPSSEYTDITVSLSLLTQISTFLSSIIAITIGLSKVDSYNTNNIIDQLQGILLRTFTIFSLCFLLISPLVMPALNTPIAFAIPISIMMIVSIPLAIISGYLNGKNKLTKVGVVALISAALQLCAGIITAYLTGSGFMTMLVMGIMQIMTVIIVYTIFANDHLPNPLTSLFKKLVHAPQMKSLITYTLLSSVAIMFVNILQIADLLIVERLEGVNVKFYTDIYVISRIVFFAGIIFIWPFLGKISITDKRHNSILLAKLISLFLIITCAALLVLLFAGEWVITLLFNANYDLGSVVVTGSLSIIYKFSLLIITATCLYYTVLRRSMALYLSGAATLTILIFASAISSSNTTIDNMLIHLNICAASIATAAVLSVILYPSKTNN